MAMAPMPMSVMAVRTQNTSCAKEVCKQILARTEATQKTAAGYYSFDEQCYGFLFIQGTDGCRCFSPTIILDNVVSSDEECWWQALCVITTL